MKSSQLNVAIAIFILCCCCSSLCDARSSVSSVGTGTTARILLAEYFSNAAAALDAGDVTAATAATTTTTNDTFLIQGKAEFDNSIIDQELAPVFTEEYPSPSFLNVSAPPITAITGLDDTVTSLLAPSSTNASASQTAICGRNSLIPSNYASDCHIFATFQRGDGTSCSASVVGSGPSSRYLSTAGHCIYNSTRGGYAIGVRIYCTGKGGCDRTTTYSRRIIVASGWLGQGGSSSTNAFDVGVIEARDAISVGRPYRYGTCAGGADVKVQVTGYPGRGGGAQCNRAKYDTCTQYSSTGAMRCVSRNGFYAPDYDTCNGMSGGGVWSSDNNWLVAIHSASDNRPKSCGNTAVPLRLRNDVDAGCNDRQRGGVSIGCLIDKFN